MDGKNTIFNVILVTVCAICIFFTIFLYRRIKDTESEYTEKEAVLIKENMDLRDRTDNIKLEIAKKKKELKAAAKDREALEEEVKSIEEENSRTKALYAEQVQKLKEEKEGLSRELSSVKGMPLVELIRKARDSEKDENLKKVLERTLNNIEMVRSGNVVDLEPIIVAKEESMRDDTSVATFVSTPAIEKGIGEILSIDKKNNLVVVNLGTRDKVEEGMRLMVLDSGEKIATGEIISSRYRVSAAFIDDIEFKRTINDIKNGLQIAIGE